jgi:hypothetical protein
MRVAAFIGFVLLPSVLFGQVNKFIDRQKPMVVEQRPEVRTVFQRIEKGISGSSVPVFSPYLGSQVFVSIRGRDEGYFSRNQAASILQNFLLSLKKTSFGFSKLEESGTNPYATGRLTFINKGNQESVQVYVALTYLDSRWVISQFNVY